LSVQLLKPQSVQLLKPQSHRLAHSRLPCTRPSHLHLTITNHFPLSPMRQPHPPQPSPSFPQTHPRYETTANTLSYCVYNIAGNPRVQERLLAEVDAFGRDRQVSASIGRWGTAAVTSELVQVELCLTRHQRSLSLLSSFFSTLLSSTHRTIHPPTHPSIHPSTQITHADLATSFPYAEAVIKESLRLCECACGGGDGPAATAAACPLY